MLAAVMSGAVVGLDGTPITVEVDITKKGFGSFKIVGLAGKAVDESRERVITALENSSIPFPKYRITVNLAPPELPKDGPLYDLPIAVGLLQAMELIPQHAISLDNYFFGALSLDGSLYATPGILPLVLLAKDQGAHAVYVPTVNAAEAAIVENITVYPVPNLSTLVLHLRGETLLPPYQGTPTTPVKSTRTLQLVDIKGQEYAKRALIVAAAGRHNIFFTGPPGSGKTMLARLLPTLIPPLTQPEAVSVSKIHSITGQLNPETPLLTDRPYRAPHHTISRVGLIGGGPHLRPGEISLAHNGVLFLDELPEFPRSVLESLRQPLEDGVVTITRALGTAMFPSQCMLIAASNPCPCGYFGSQQKACTCHPLKVQQYQKRLSGPLLDRIDIHVYVREVSAHEILDHTRFEGIDERTVTTQQQIMSAHHLQIERYKELGISANALLPSSYIPKYCSLDDTVKKLVIHAANQLHLSARAIHKTLKVARTIADLASCDTIETTHITEALQYRHRISNNTS